ncbi:MAG: adenylate/guanylate cyclase domain-containing protein [Gammaproteobacteria bacterium]|nr:adenylate/guanylate cyclase domain-containing protein [Gammaproteobacteria bacterium]
MSPTQNQRKTLIIIGLILISLALTALLNHFNFFSRLELASFDHRVSMFRSDKYIHEDVVLVNIDEETLQQMSNELGRWPWPRSAYRDILDFFALAGAEALAFDILFVEQEAAGGVNANDQQLIAASRDSAIAVHAMQLLENAQMDGAKPMPTDFIRQHQVDNIDFAGKNYNDFLIPLEGLYQASRAVGYLEIEPDRDGVFRRLRLFNQYDRQAVFPAISSALVLPLIADGGEIVYDANATTVGDTSIPLDGNGHYLMNPYGGLNEIPAHQVFAAMQQIRAGHSDDLVLDPADFRNKIVLLGASAIGLLDVKPTAISNKEPGVRMHAYTVSNILEQDFLVAAGNSLTYSLVTLFSIVSVLSIMLIPRLIIGALIPLVIAVVYIFITYSLFASNQVLDLMPVLFAIAFSLLLAFSYRSYTEKHGKQRIRAMLSQYVSPSVLTNVIDNYDTLSAEVGSNETLSILFSDIRGFTEISETQAAPKVVDMLNIYFSQMTDIIFEHDGTLDKFIGDAIMAFWGAPIKTDNHADQAVQAAIMMRQQLAAVNQVLAAKDYAQIDIGIGIHTGKVVLGNIGSAKKLDYTVIGDGVNLASRIEGITKQYKLSILISEDTHAALTTAVPCIVVDVVRLKGKQQPIRLYTPAEVFRAENNITMPLAELIKSTEQAFDHYQDRQWDKALNLYQQLPQCELFNTLTDRCVSFTDDEPNEDWDGVYTHTSK